MGLEEIRQFILSSCGYLHHIGMLVEDWGRAAAELETIPGLDKWTANTSTWYGYEMLVGSENTMVCSTARILDGILLEVIEPVKAKCEGTHFSEYLEHYGSGLHHICYGFPHYEDFQRVYECFQDLGFQDVIHGQKRSESGEITDEYCYFKVFEEKVFVELNWTRHKWGY